MLAVEVAGRTSYLDGPEGRYCYGGQCAGEFYILMGSAAKEVTWRVEQPQDRPFKVGTSVAYAIYVCRHK